MPSKASKNCCCDGCHERPTIFGRASGAIQEWQNFCCGCIPKRICVTIECVDTYETATLEFTRDCTEGLTYPIVYSGEIPFREYLIDLQFRFRVEYGECYYCLTSTFLNISESSLEHCHLIDEYARADKLFCAKLWLQGSPAEFTITGATAAQVCPSGDLRITTASAGYTPITNRPPVCLDQQGNEVPDTAAIRNMCGDCACICTCACITVRVNGVATETYTCIDATDAYNTPVWRTVDDGSGYGVALEANYETNCCQLALIEFAGNDPLVDLDPVRIGTVGNPCQSPEASWEWYDYEQNFYQLDWRCAPCNGCGGIVTLCCNTILPRVLTATITISGGGCSCSELVMSLVYDRPFGGWLGESATGFCSHGIELSLSCGEPLWNLGFVAGVCIVVPGDSLSAYATDCDPVNIVFSFRVSGLGCCGPGLPTSPATVTVTITE